MNKVKFPDKYKLTKDQNRRFARMNLTRLVYTNSRFEGVNTTMPQTQTIIDGLGVSGVSIDDINTIVQLKRAWQLVISSDAPLNLDFEKNVNQVVAKLDSLDPGHLRTGNGLVNTMNGQYVPPLVDEEYEQHYLQTLLQNSKQSVTEKALRLMYHNMKQQIFWDGNKRTATLVANKLMIDNGAGLINVPLDKWETWNQLISDYYDSGNMDQLLTWTYDVGINGVDFS